jgi:hypothetical protein
VLQFCAIAVLAWTVWALQPAATVADGRGTTYRGLGDAASSAGGDAIVFFVAGTTEIEMRRTLQLAGARIVDGPSATGAYVLRFERDVNETALAALRRDPNVTRVEGLSAGSASPARSSLRE